MGAGCTRERSDNVRRAQSVPVPVMLHIYSVGTSRNTQMVNSLLRQLGTGAFHCGVEVFGCEWSYSDIACAHDKDRAVTGIFCCQPRHCEGHCYSESIPMGTTAMTEGEVLSLVSLLKKDWPAHAYSTLCKNCCHFGDELCQRLGVGSIPRWVMNLAGAGAAVVNAGDTVCCRTMAGQTARSMLCCGAQRGAIGPGKTCGCDDAEVVQVDVVEALPVLPPFGNHPSMDSLDLLEKSQVKEDASQIVVSAR